MEKSKTLVHFLAAVLLIVFAVAIFKVTNGTVSLVRPLKEDGSYDFSGMLSLVVPFNLCILAFAGLITVLNEGEFSAWFGAAAVIVGIAAVGFFLGFSPFAGLLVGGLYAVWWLIAAFKSVIATWGDNGFWASRLLAFCRLLVAAMLAVFVLFWLATPYESMDVLQDAAIVTMYNWTGVACIVGAVALCVEGVIWLIFCEY